MADFCNQCEPDLGGLKGLSTEEDTKNHIYCVVLCEGCGAIQVDHLGNCVSHDHHPDGTYTERVTCPGEEDLTEIATVTEEIEVGDGTNAIAAIRSTLDAAADRAIQNDQQGSGRIEPSKPPEPVWELYVPGIQRIVGTSIMAIRLPSGQFDGVHCGKAIREELYTTLGACKAALHDYFSDLCAVGLNPQDQSRPLLDWRGTEIEIDDDTLRKRLAQYCL